MTATPIVATADTPRLFEKATLKKLTIGRPTLTKPLKGLTDSLRAQENDASLNVTTKLFVRKDSPIRLIMRALNDVYAYHKKHTLPYNDAGPRLLPNALYFTYETEISKLCYRVEALMLEHMPNYDLYVQQDLDYRRSMSPNAATRASLDQYPTAAQFEESTTITIEPQTVTNTSHFLFDISERDRKAAIAAEARAIKLANEEVINRMLVPLHALCNRLSEYKGEKGERFHDTIISNVLDGCDIARQLTLDPSPELTAAINGLEDLAATYLNSVELIKTSPETREHAFNQLAAAADKMAQYF